MFSSSILDVAAGVIFAFLAVSLFTSAAVETISSLFKLRSSNLLSGVKQLVNDPDFTGLAKTLYEHAAVNPRGPGVQGDPLKNRPAYIEARQFAGALLDITGLSAASATEAAAAPGPAAVAALKSQLKATNPQLDQLLNGLIERTAGDIGRIEAELGRWFDNGMDRLSGTFKRQTQLATFIIALLISVGINVDSVRIATMLWEHPTQAAALARSVDAQPVLDPKAADQAQQAIATLNALQMSGLPVGWAPEHLAQTTDAQGHWIYIWESKAILWSIAGWLITAIAALFGAPFWFDTLQTFVRLKGSGPRPGEKT